MLPIPKIGLGLLSFNLSPPDSFSWPKIYRQGILDARQAESLGLESIWLSEHHFVPDGYCPSLLPVAAALLQATESLIIGTAAFLLPLADEGRLVHQIRALGTLRERLRLGVAIGYREAEFLALGVDRRKRGQIMDSLLEPLIDELGEDSIVICASSRAAVERALRYNLPMMTDEALPVSTACSWAREFRASSDKELTMYRGIWLSEDGTAPPAKALERDLAYWQYLSWDYSPSWEDSKEPIKDPFSRGNREHIEQTALQGEEKWLRCTPEAFSTLLEKLSETGFDRFIARLTWAGTPLESSVVKLLSDISRKGERS